MKRVLTIILIAIIAISCKTSQKTVDAVMYFDYPEEWRAITVDTMQVIRVGDTLVLNFIHPPMDTTGQYERAIEKMKGWTLKDK